MWTRKSVKGKGKIAFLGNFWKSVLVALILGLVLSSSGSFGGSSYKKSGNNSISNTTIITEDFTIPVDMGIINNNNPASVDDGQVSSAIGAGVALSLVILVVCIIATVITMLLKYLLLSPFEYGCRKFFRKNLDEPAKLSNIVYVFNSHYKNVVKTAFLTDLFVFLWSLLFVIPGIIKAYSYRLVPYIVSENPEISYKDALAESAKLMNGNKWKSFVLDLSFIGWELLSLITFGLVGLFYVNPYKASTDAALYEAIKYGIDVQ